MSKPLRVLWLCKGLGPGGAERLLVEQAAAGNRDGFQYEVAYLLPWKRHLVPELEALGVATHCLHVRTEADPRWLTRLWRLLGDRRFDVVHAHSPMAAALARPLLRLHGLVRGRRPGIVYTEHNRWPSYRPVTRWCNTATYGLNDAVIAVSEDVRASVARRWRDRVEVVIHGIDVDRVRAYACERPAVRTELGVADDEILCVTIANLREGKGYPGLLEAARQALTMNRRLRFVAAGQGPLEAELHALHDRLELGDRFRFLGYVEHAARLLAGADLFVMASHHEGLPVSVMEALALGVPVVATRVGGIPELVLDGVNGVLVTPGDPGALAGAIRSESTNLCRRVVSGPDTQGPDIAPAFTVVVERLYRQTRRRAANGEATPAHVPGAPEPSSATGASS